jgi:beta-lactamase superfamily II metal-dependent hydrolase
VTSKPFATLILSLPDLTILDVGHGNCAIVQDSDQVIVIDAPLGDTELKRWLDAHEIGTIEAVVVSHADEDHIGGVLSLLTDPNVVVRHLYLNSESQRGTKIWEDLRAAVPDARSRSDLRVHVELTTENSADFELPSLSLEVLAPSPELAMSGASGTTPSGRPLTANAMSAVIRVRRESGRGVLLMGDIDATGLDELVEGCADLDAALVVFPHHGGRPGAADMTAFAHRVAECVRPEIVVFSLGRGKHGTPQPAIVDGVRAAAPEAHIACTQLSERCAEVLPGISQEGYLSDAPARGRAFGACCAGTLDVSVTTNGVDCAQVDGHRRFVEDLPTPVCRRQLPMAS